jgi:hypothetical protein
MIWQLPVTTRRMATGVELSTEPITQFFMLPLPLCCTLMLNGPGMRECKQRLVHS